MKSKDNTLAVDLNALDLVLDAFATSLLNPKADRAVVYGDINQQLVACTGAIASLIVAQNREGQVRVLGQAGWDALPNSTSGPLKGLIKQLFATESPVGLHELKQHSVFVGKSRPLAGLELLYLLVRSDDSSSLSNQVFCDLANEIATQVESFEILRRGDHRPKSVEQLTQITHLVQNLGKSNGLEELAYHFVNDVAKITRSSRVTLLTTAGKLLAISGVAGGERRTGLSRSLSTIARQAIASRGSVEWANGELLVDGPRSPRGLKVAIENLGTPIGFAVPLKSEDRVNGVVLLEYLEDDAQAASVERRELINETLKFATPVFSRAISVNSIPAIGFANFLFNRILVRPVSSIVKLTVVGVMLMVALFVLFGVQRPFEISAQGVLQVSESHNIFAPVQGEVDQVLVGEGNNVSADQIVAILKSADIDEEFVEVEGELAEAQQQLRNLILGDDNEGSIDELEAIRARNAAEAARLKIRIETLQQRQEFLTLKQKRMTLHAPIAGQVTTPDLEQRLIARPLNRGDVMMTISNTEGPWELELLVPDNCVQYITQWQQQNQDKPVIVKFRLVSASEQMFKGELREFDFRAELNADQSASFAKAIVDLDETELKEVLRLGSRVYGKFECGEKSNFFLLTYELRNKLREWFFF